MIRAWDAQLRNLQDAGAHFPRKPIKFGKIVWRLMYHVL